jgi:two-component system, OmpR family, sensor histidine kinase KdpD
MKATERRPSPEELLRRVQEDERRESRGRLKVFLGYASRVGKSYRMFDEGRRRHERGQDVVVGAVQRKVPADIQAILDRLEIIPTITERHAGREYQVLDVAALFRRHPSLILIDGLANANAPGNRNPQRWQDVEELLNRGISVLSAVNLQHIREKQDEVEKITGKRAADSIPLDFLREADEIEVVDAPPEDLLDRGEATAEETRRLGELRELALLLAADVVETQLQGYLDEHGVGTSRWGAQERLLVCLTPRSNAADMLRSGRRNAERFHGALLAAYVDQGDLGPQDRERLDANLALAQELGAEVHCLKGTDFVSTILDFAHAERVTQIFIGHSQSARGPVDRLIDGAEDFDVRIFPQRAGS